MVDLAEWRYECGVIKGLAEARVRLFHSILPTLGEEEAVSIYGPTADKGLSQEHITKLLDIVKTMTIEEGIGEYAGYLASNLDEKAAQSLQICIRSYRVECAVSRLKDRQSPGWVLDHLCSLYEISFREAADIIESALTQIQEEYEEARLERRK